MRAYVHTIRYLTPISSKPSKKSKEEEELDEEIDNILDGDVTQDSIFGDEDDDDEDEVNLLLGEDED